MTTELTAKRLALLHELLPAAARFAVLVNPNVPRTAASVAGPACRFTEQLASNGCALGNYTFAPAAAHTRRPVWVKGGRGAHAAAAAGAPQ
jgi:hypothetical protein